MLKWRSVWLTGRGEVVVWAGCAWAFLGGCLTVWGVWYGVDRWLKEMIRVVTRNCVTVTNCPCH